VQSVVALRVLWKRMASSFFSRRRQEVLQDRTEYAYWTVCGQSGYLEGRGSWGLLGILLRKKYPPSLERTFDLER